MLLLILLLLVLLLLVLLLLVLFVVLILVVATTTAIVLVFLQHEESHGEVVARLVVVGIAAQRALVEFDGLLEGGSRVALLHAHGSHSLSVPNIAHIVEVGCSALGVGGAKRVSPLVVFEGGGVFLLHDVCVAEVVVCLE